MASHEIEALVQALARLPGLGPRSARRAVLHLLKRREGALAPLLGALERVNARITQLAHGLPVGGELDYLDDGTLAQALRARRPVA